MMVTGRDSFTGGLISKTGSSKNNASSTYDDYNSRIFYHNKTQPLGAFLEMEKHKQNSSQWAFTSNSSYVSLHIILSNLMEACLKKKCLSSKDVYLSISKLANYKTTEIPFMTMGIITRVCENLTPSCPKKCKSLIVHCKENSQLGIVLFFRGNHDPLEVGQEILIVNPLVICSTGSILRYDQQTSNFIRQDILSHNLI